MHELKMKTQNKEELNQDMVNLKKRIKWKSQEKKIPLVKQKNIVEDDSSRLEQMECRISEFEDKIEFKDKSRRNLGQTTQEL
jgi:hypothetical protein